MRGDQNLHCNPHFPALVFQRGDKHCVELDGKAFNIPPNKYPSEVRFADRSNAEAYADLVVKSKLTHEGALADMFSVDGDNFVPSTVEVIW